MSAALARLIVVCSIDSVELVDGEKATLRAVKESQGGSHTGIMAGAWLRPACSFGRRPQSFSSCMGRMSPSPKGPR